CVVGQAIDVDPFQRTAGKEIGVPGLTPGSKEDIAGRTVAQIGQTASRVLQLCAQFPYFGMLRRIGLALLRESRLQLLNRGFSLVNRGFSLGDLFVRWSAR